MYGTIIWVVERNFRQKLKLQYEFYDRGCRIEQKDTHGFKMCYNKSCQIFSNFLTELY